MSFMQPREVNQAIDNYIGEYVCVGTEDATNYASTVIIKPPYEYLFRHYCRGIVNRRISRMRDKDGLRNRFSNGKRHDLKYVLLKRAGESELFEVRAAKAYQEKQVKQMQRNVAKISAYEEIISEQASQKASEEKFALADREK